MLAQSYTNSYNPASSFLPSSPNSTAEVIESMPPLAMRRFRVNDKEASRQCIPGTLAPGSDGMSCNWRRISMGQLGWQARCRTLPLTVTDISNIYGVSRQAVYKNIGYASLAMPALSMLPPSIEYSVCMDRKNIEKLAISLVVDGHCSHENAHRVMASILGGKAAPCSTSIQGIIARAGKFAKKIMTSVSFAGIKQCASDEIFLANGQPVLAVICLDTTFVLAIVPMNDRKSETWELVMSMLKDQGLELEVSVTDAGKGLLRGIKSAFPDADLQIDVFHVLKGLHDVLRSFHGMVDSRIAEFCTLDDKLKALRAKRRTYFTEQEIKAAGKKLKAAGEGIDELMDDGILMRCLQGWFHEMLGLSGYTPDETMGLLTWLLAEMDAIASRHACTKVQREASRLLDKLPQVLVFLGRLFKRFRQKAEDMGIKEEAFHLLYRRASIDKEKAPNQYQALTKEAADIAGCAGLEALERAHNEIVAAIRRASSLIENLNSRLRMYMDIKRNFSEDFCYLLQLSINLKKYRRTRIRSRKGRSPMDILKKKDGQDRFPELTEFLDQHGFWDVDETKIA